MKPATAARPHPQPAPLPSAATLANWEKKFPPLSEETREVIPTAQAAHYLCRAEQTLREWSCLGSGLLAPVKIGARLGWRTADIRRLLGVAE